MGLRYAIDRFDKRGLQGWAWDGTEARITLELSINGIPFGSVLANQLRSDLVSALGAATGQHGFSCQMPLAARLHGAQVRLTAGITVLIDQYVPADPDLIVVHGSGALTAWADRSAGGIICGLRSADFPEVDNFIDDGEQFGRSLQCDVGNYVDAFNPTEGGSLAQGSRLVAGPTIQQDGSLLTIVRMRNWADSAETSLELTRVTRLRDQMLLTHWSIVNQGPLPVTDYISADLFLDPRYLDRYEKEWQRRAEPGNPSLIDAPRGIGVVYNGMEGRASVALAFTSRWTAAQRELIIDGDDLIGEAQPRTFMVGNRTEPVALRPGVPFVGEFALALTRGTGAARALIEVWDRG